MILISCIGFIQIYLYECALNEKCVADAIEIYPLRILWHAMRYFSNPKCYVDYILISLRGAFDFQWCGHLRSGYQLLAFKWILKSKKERSRM